MRGSTIDPWQAAVCDKANSPDGSDELPFWRQVIERNDGFRMGEPVRRLRALLPGQAGGRR